MAGLMKTVQQFARYDAIVGVFAELYPLIYRVMSLMTSKGAYGLGYLAQVMNQAIAKEEKVGRHSNHLHKDFISIMFAMHDRDPTGFTQDDIRYHIIPSIGGGSDTTAITIGAVIYYLCKSETVLHKLRWELEQSRHARRLSHPVKWKEAQDCPYLQVVIKEAMRMCPGNGLPMPRIVPEGGLTLAGHSIPAGVSNKFHIPLPLIHRDDEARFFV